MVIDAAAIAAIENVATVVVQQQNIVAVKPTYSVLRSNIIRITPESMQCKLYCRGTACKYCTPTGWSQAEQAIRGGYSSCLVKFTVFLNSFLLVI